MLKHVEIEIKYEYDIYTVAKYLLLKKKLCLIITW